MSSHFKWNIIIWGLFLIWDFVVVFSNLIVSFWPQNVVCGIFFFFFLWHVVSYFQDQGSDPRLLQQKSGVFTTGPLGKSQEKWKTIILAAQGSPCGSDSKISWRRGWQPTCVFLPREFYGQNMDRLLSMASQRVGHNWVILFDKHYISSRRQKSKEDGIYSKNIDRPPGICQDHSIS